MAKKMLTQFRFISARAFVCKAFRALLKVVFLFAPFSDVGIILRLFDLHKLVHNVDSTTFSTGSAPDISITAHHLLSENRSANAVFTFLVVSPWLSIFTLILGLERMVLPRDAMAELRLNE